MEASFPSTAIFFRTSTKSFCGTGITANPNPNPNRNALRRNGRSKVLNGAGRIRAMDEVVALADPGQVTVTWEIVVGALAGVTPFVIAGIEFRKRIVAQRNCVVCSGSGLVRREKFYFRCPRCGGFLPWQSWKRFFSG